jgi:hypothetical protein
MTAAEFALSVLGALPLVAAVWYRLQRFQRGRYVLQFSRNSPIDLVLTTSQVAPAEHGVPAHRPLTGYGQIRAVASCAKALAALYPRKEVHIHLSGFIRNRLDRDLVVLGGPAKNVQARAIIDDLLRQHDLTKFTFDDVADKLEIVGPGTMKHEIPSFSPEITDGYPETDYGLIIATYHIGSGGRRCRSILCAGFTTYGTAAAADYLFTDMVKLAPWRFARQTKVSAVGRSRAFIILVSARFSRGECIEVHPVFSTRLRKRS